MNYNKATFDRAFGISAQLPPADGIEIAFAGRSNVGKSSLLSSRSCSNCGKVLGIIIAPVICKSAPG